MPDVVIVGGGVMGCASALSLARAGLSVTVLERSVPGAEASSAAAGILGPAVEAHADDPAMLRLGLRSRELHAELAAWLREEHGVDVGFRRCGVLLTATPGEEVGLDAHHARVAAHTRCEAIDGDEARRREPNLGPAFVRALDLPEEAQLEPKRLLAGLALAAERAGATFRTGAIVERVVVEGRVEAGRVEAGRVVGVQLGAERIDAAHVVVAAGSWTHLVPGLELEAAGIHPVRGQILRTRTRPPLFERIVFGAGGYVVTRPSGEVLCGSTEERVGFRREVTLGGMRQIVQRATTVAPLLAHAPVLDSWSSFRPGTADGRPLVGPAGPAGLVLAAGHFRNGILLAPVTGELVLRCVQEGALPEGAEHVDPRRFANGASS